MARIEKRTLRDGSLRYKVIIRRKDLPMKTKTFGTWAAADYWAKRQEGKILDRKAIPDWEAEKHTLSEAIDGYLEDWLPDLADTEQHNRRWQLKWWGSKLGHVQLLHVNLGMISDARRDLLKERKFSGATANRYVAALSAVLNYCVSERHWIDRNPARGLKRKAESQRDRFLSGTERECLLEVCQQSEDQRLYPLVLFALATGARQGELLGLKWKDVDLPNKRATLHKTKNRDKRTLHFPGRAGEVLREMSRTPHISGHLFAHPKTCNPSLPQAAWYKALAAADEKLKAKAEEDVSRARQALAKRRKQRANPEAIARAKQRLAEALTAQSEAGLDDFRFHDLRHSAASYVAQSGATLAELAAFLGHRSLASVKRYAHLTEQHQEGVAARMSEQYLADL